MIIRSGENIYPVEIEHRLESHSSVSEAAVIGVDHQDRGQEVKAIVVPEGKINLDADTLREWCSETLADYKVPVIWEWRSTALPRNASGKVVKRALTGDTELSNHQD